MDITIKQSIDKNNVMIKIDLSFNPSRIWRNIYDAISALNIFNTREKETLVRAMDPMEERIKKMEMDNEILKSYLDDFSRNDFSVKKEESSSVNKENTNAFFHSDSTNLIIQSKAS